MLESRSAITNHHHDGSALMMMRRDVPFAFGSVLRVKQKLILQKANGLVIYFKCICLERRPSTSAMYPIGCEAYPFP